MVVAIISLLVSVLVPSLKRAKDIAESVVCRSNQRGIFQCQLFYAADYDGRMVQTSYPPERGGGWWPSRFSVYATWRKAEVPVEDHRADIYRCAAFQKQVLPRWQWKGTAFSYGLNTWVTYGWANEYYPPFTP